MTDQLLGFVMFWGVWLFVPMLIDGATAVAYFMAAFRSKRQSYPTGPENPLKEYPLVSVIIPAFNAADVLGTCLESIRRQSYPHRQIEVLVVDNKSTDTTQVVLEAEQATRFDGVINWLSLPYQGKSEALNAGIHRVRGEIIVNIDADTVLHGDALLEMVRAFELNRNLAAATGAIEVLRANRDPINGEAKDVHPAKYILAEAEFLEYYAGFRIGRQYQSQTNSLFTLAGAFSGFRREILLQTFMYDDRTVSEDTDLTFYIVSRFPERDVRVVAEAVAYVHPTESLKALYAQRLRWQRGQLEVASMYPQYERHPFRLRGLTLQKALIVDHTLAFPRVVWTFLLPMMYFLGYPLGLVVSATLSLYVIYMFVDALYIAVSYSVSTGEARARIRGDWWMFLFMPLYRWMTFWFRFGGFLAVMMEDKQWRARDPITETRDGLQRVTTVAMTFLTQSFLPRLASILSGVTRINR